VIRPSEVTSPGLGWREFKCPAYKVRSSKTITYEQMEGILSGAYGPPETHEHTLRHGLMSFFSLSLTGRERHSLAADQDLGDLNRPQRHLAQLFANDALRERVSDRIHEAFGLYFTLDPTARVGHVTIRLNRSAPPSPDVERALTDPAVQYHRTGVPIGSLSDGVQAYVGLLSGIFGLPHRIILVDEPEAFLPPPQQRRLGSAIAGVGRERDASVIAATHSAWFLMGCIQSGADVTIVRLTYESATGAATARQLAPGSLRPLMNDPLLRSSRALEGLFHRAVIVGEADADRAFYDEINRRLNDVGRGITDAQFVNAQNWQTEARIIGPLRRLGVPAVAVLDLDALWNISSQWKPFYRAAGMEEGSEEWLDLEAARQAAAVMPAERAIGKKSGIQALPVARRRLVETAVAKLAEYGVFLAPVGELESWLTSVGVTKSGKSEWIVQMFGKLGSDASKPNYVKASSGDVWGFLDSIEEWVNDPARRGMP
jgi:hypothetical protein